MFIIVAIACLVVGVALGYVIADKASQHAIYAARAKGLIEGQGAGALERHAMFQELQRLRARNRRLETRERTLTSTRPSA
jgi:uncharacterized protein involved in exopolysaccharide biosynthesis